MQFMQDGLRVRFAELNEINEGLMILTWSRRGRPFLGWDSRGAAHQFLRDLNSIQSSALKQLITGDPKGQAVIESTILTETSDRAVVLFSLIQRQRITVLGGFIYHLKTRRLA